MVRAHEWRWSSLWRRGRCTAEEQSLLSAWPIERPSAWGDLVNEVENEKDLESLRQSVQRGRPFGQAEWQKRIAERLGLESDWSRHIVPLDVPERRGREKQPYTDHHEHVRQQVAQFSKIGPVPLFRLRQQRLRLTEDFRWPTQW
jgi:hypothetical protein